MNFMKKFTFLPVFLILVTAAISQQAGKEALPAALAFEMAEYETKRTEGLNRLKELAKAQLQVVLKDQMSEGKLEEANAINKVVAALPITTQENATPPARLPSMAAVVLKDHTSKVFAGISGLNNQFIPRLDKVKVELLKSGDLDGANAADVKIRELREEAAKLVPPKLAPGARQETVENFTVEAQIDGNTELHVTKEGIYWTVPGGEAKPGLHDGANEPTYVNGARWKPKWRAQGTRGPDTSEVYPVKTTSPKLMAETMLVSSERFGKNENRTPIATSVKEDHFVVTIRDPEGGSRWYKIRIKSVP